MPKTPDQTSRKPATPLPWTQSNQIGADGDRFIISDDADRYPVSRAEPKDAAYIVAACNAYPQLVAALRAMIGADMTAESGIAATMHARALLRSLGEV